MGEVVHGVLVSRDHMWLSLVSYAGMNARSFICIP